MAAPETENALALPELTPPPHLLIVCAPFYHAIAEGLIAGAVATLDQVGASHEVIRVPGALEIPPAIRIARDSHMYEGYIALGCVIRGETTHYETVCNDSSRGLMDLGTGHGLAIGNGILTCETMAQAEVRADPAAMNKGGGAAAAALHLIALRRRFHPSPAPDRPLPDGPEMLIAGAPGLNRTA
ncbi:MAG: 6,7-dimethyl-8-ribityllumazine synthase [Pseudomonadota bacterium]